MSTLVPYPSQPPLPPFRPPWEMGMVPIPGIRGGWMRADLVSTADVPLEPFDQERARGMARELGRALGRLYVLGRLRDL